MAATSEGAKPSWSERWFSYRNRKLSDPQFQRWASSFPLTRRIAAQRGQALFDISAGFVYSQVLLACVRVKLFETLAAGPLRPDMLSRDLALPLPAMTRLLTAAEGLKLVETRPGGLVGLGVHGAAALGNPAIAAMVEHNAMLYRDLEDPIALLRGEKSDTALAAFWPYGQATSARSDGGDMPMPSASGPAAPSYSAIMDTSQALIADDILDAYPFPEKGSVLDIGGGEGAFLIAAATRRTSLRLVLFDLPPVADRARQRFAQARFGDRASAIGGDFRTDSLPAGADLITLVRIVHDHDDATVAALLKKVFDTLAPGGMLLLAEPFAATTGAESVGAYFAFYLLAMRQGRPRSESELQALLYAAGFARVRAIATARPMLTSLIVAQKSAGPANRSVKSS